MNKLECDGADFINHLEDQKKIYNRIKKMFCATEEGIFLNEFQDKNIKRKKRDGRDSNPRPPA